MFFWRKEDVAQKNLILNDGASNFLSRRSAILLFQTIRTHHMDDACCVGGMECLKGT